MRFVFFGATGDLAYKQIFPALQGLVRDEGFDLPIIGVAKAGWTLDQLKARAKDSLSSHGGLDTKLPSPSCTSLFRYVDGDYNDPVTYGDWRKELKDAIRPLHYLAIPPSLFATVVEGLANQGAQDARLVIEKPLATIWKAARQLDRILNRFFPEEDIFRIDHYLGKEPVQNILYTRFANSMFEPVWNRIYINSIQINMAESFGVAGSRQILRRDRCHSRRVSKPPAAGARQPDHGSADG